jgi:hypothetical protein
MGRSALIRSKAIEVEAAQASLPAPVDDGDGKDVTDWRIGGRAPRLYDLAIAASEACTLSDVYLAGYRDGSWRNLGNLNGGQDIDLTADVGWSGGARDLGLFDRLALVAGVSAGTVTFTVTPVER